MRLVWADATGNTVSELSGRWGDACALQFPLKPKEGDPSPMMGHQGGSVNIWRWAALGQTPVLERYPKAYSDWDRRRTIEKFLPGQPGAFENLTAEGFGSLTRQVLGSLQASGRAAKTVGWQCSVAACLMPKVSS